MLSLDFLALPLMAAAALIFVAVFAGIISSRVGFPFLLVFLIVGMLSGEDGIGGISFDNFALSFWVGNIALAVILVDGGLRTDFATFRTGLKPSLILATLGVLLSAGLTGLAAMWLLGLSWPMAMLLGAIVGSTDAAAVFSLLKSCGVRLNERVAATLEIESGMNDPMAVYLTLTFISIALIYNAGETLAFNGWTTLLSLTTQFGIGGLIGYLAGIAMASAVNRIRGMLDSGAGILALLLMSAGIGVFAFATWVGGSGTGYRAVTDSGCAPTSCVAVPAAISLHTQGNIFYRLGRPSRCSAGRACYFSHDGGSGGSKNPFQCCFCGRSNLIAVAGGQPRLGGTTTGTGTTGKG